ncbi:MAG: hypothetical protein H6636_06435 [Anaerolineales bacterium]|nr:hypothetical protein [Anaerolineales bacterium]
MPHTKACFVDESPPLLAREHPNQWMTCRTACDEHRSLALLPDGENLFAFLARRADKTFPFEGSGFNYLINPVTLKGIRSWCDFHFETPVIYEEIFPSTTYFDFFVQHIEEIQPFFYLFCQTYEKLQESGSFFNTILAIRKENPTTEKYLNDLINMWTLQESLHNELKARRLSWLESPDQAHELFFTVYERLNEETVLANVVNDMLERLLELGKVRFAHL